MHTHTTREELFSPADYSLLLLLPSNLSLKGSYKEEEDANYEIVESFRILSLVCYYSYAMSLPLCVPLLLCPLIGN